MNRTFHDSKNRRNTLALLTIGLAWAVSLALVTSANAQFTLVKISSDKLHKLRQCA
jgi:hypothetical protein